MTMIFLILALISLSVTHGLLSSKFSSSRLQKTMLNAELFTHYEEISISTLKSVSLTDITKSINDILKKTECKEGVLTLLSKHSTVSVTINEMEGRLVDDTRQFLLKIAPPDHPYLHNDLDFRWWDYNLSSLMAYINDTAYVRTSPPDWPGGDEAWRAFRATQPVNAHSHLIAWLLGTFLVVYPVHCLSTVLNHFIRF